MQFFITAILGISVASVLYKIAISLFSEGYVRFISICYLVAIWLFIIFLMVPYFYPSMIGNESWGYFIIYAPLFALIYLLPTLLSVGIAHIACKIKYRNNKNSIGTADKLLWTVIIIFPVSLIMLPFSLIGILLVAILSVYRSVCFISRKIKQTAIFSAREKIKIIIAVVGIFIFLSPVVLVGSSLLGRPVESFFVNRRVQAHVAQYYSELDLRVGRTQWGFMSTNYTTRIYYRNNNEIFFNINYSSRSGISDNYTGGSFWAGRLRMAHLSYVEEHFGDDLRSFNVSVRGLQIGEMPNQSENLTVMVDMELTIENVNPITISEVHLHLHEILQHSEIPFTNYRMIFFLPDGRRAAQVELHARHVNDDLPILIEYLQNNLNEHARYVDRERGTSYWAFLNE